MKYLKKVTTNFDSFVPTDTPAVIWNGVEKGTSGCKVKGFPKNIILINFSITDNNLGQTWSFQAENGMNWYDFCHSTYNTNNWCSCRKDSDGVEAGDPYHLVSDDGASPNWDDIIIAKDYMRIDIS